MEVADLITRLERATKIAAGSIPVSSSPPPPLSSLSDLLRQGNGRSPALPCSVCKVDLPRAASVFCLSCGAVQHHPSPIAFRSTLASRRLLATMQITDPENSFGNVVVIKEPWQGQQPVRQSEVVNSKSVESNDTSDPVIVKEKEPVTDYPIIFKEKEPVIDFPVVFKEKEPVIDYSSKIEGISLDDFFLGQKQPESTAAPEIQSSATADRSFPQGLFLVNPLMDDKPPPSLETLTEPSGSTSMQTEHHNSLFDDFFLEPVKPLTVSDPLSSTQFKGETEVDDDSLFSWESEFQSAAPISSTGQTDDKFLQNEDGDKGDDDDDLFGDFVKQGDASGVGASQVAMTSFETNWHQASTPQVVRSSSLDNGQDFMFHSAQIDPHVVPDSETADKPELVIQGETASDEKNERLEALLAQLPDLSFMLADQLCIPK